MAVVVPRFDVYLVSLDPTVGREIQKSRPWLIISPDEMNRHIGTVIIAPMTTQGRGYPTRVPCEFQGMQGQIVLDQIRTSNSSVSLWPTWTETSAWGEPLGRLGTFLRPQDSPRPKGRR